VKDGISYRKGRFGPVEQCGEKATEGTMASEQEISCHLDAVLKDWDANRTAF
jgi:hypothetical protein